MKNYFYDEAAKTISSIKENSGKEDYCFALLTDTKLYDTGDDTRENISMQLLSTELDMYKKSISSKKLYVTPGMHDGYRDESFVGQLAEDIISDDIWYDFSHSILKSRFETGKDPFIYNGCSTEAILRLLQQAVTNGINIAGWFCGAYGYDAEFKLGGINFISINSQLSHCNEVSKCNGVRFSENRDVGTVNQDCWDAVIVNTNDRKIRLFRFGCGEDRELTY